MNIQTEFVQEEKLSLRREIIKSRDEIMKIKAVPLVIGHFNEMIDHNNAIVSASSGNNYYVKVLSILERESLKPNVQIVMHRHSYAVVDILPSEMDSNIQIMKNVEDTKVRYEDIGGYD